MKWPKPKCSKIKNIPKPRQVIPVIIDGIDQFNDPWSVKLERISITEVRKNFGFPPVHKDTYKNLQIWVDHLGPALYNPVWWRYHSKPLPPRHTRYPHRDGHYEILHGCHRARALERLDFPYIFAYIHYGRTYWNPSNPNWTREVTDQFEINNKEPIIYTHHGLCEKCGNGVRWGGPSKGEGGADNFKATKYTCGHCGYNGVRPEIYPEPV